MSDWFQLIDVNLIQPSPFQHRKSFNEDALQELAVSIGSDGLIQPITVRQVNGYFELIAGERRWRAVKGYTTLSAIAARIIDVDDTQARRLCATENLQRVDLTALEEVMALAELIDASLLIEFGDEYANIGKVQESRWRVKALLTKLESDRKHGTDKFGSKFTAKTKAIFDGLPKPRDLVSFATNDLPLLFTHEEVQQFALQHKLNKSQTKAASDLHKVSPKVFKELAEEPTGKAAIRISNLAGDPYSFVDDDPETIGDLSAETIRRAARSFSREVSRGEADTHNHRAQGTGDNEWYTPLEHIEAARSVLGEIDLDPASSALANEAVRATQFFTIDDDGLKQQWSGNVYLNPPYSQPTIAYFAEKLASEWEAGNITAAIALTHNYTDTAWFHRLAKACSAICFTRGRIAFINSEGEKAAPTQGQAFFYFGDRVDAFLNEFSKVGLVVFK